MSNTFVDKYKNSIRLRDNFLRLSNELLFKNYSKDLFVKPTHFNYFYFEVVIDDKKSILTVDDARKLAKYLLEFTENIENPHKLVREIMDV